MRKTLISAMALLVFGGTAQAKDIFTSGCKEIAEKAAFEKLDITPIAFEGIQLATGTIHFKAGERNIFVSNRKPDVNGARAFFALTGNMWLLSSPAPGQEKQLNIIAATGLKSCDPVVGGEKFMGASYQDFREAPTDQPVEFTSSACFIEVIKPINEEGATYHKVIPSRFNNAARAISLYDGANHHVFTFKNDEDYASAVATTIRGSWFVYMPKGPIPVSSLKQNTKGQIVAKWMGITAGNATCRPLGNTTLPYKLVPASLATKMNLKG